MTTNDQEFTQSSISDMIRNELECFRDANNSYKCIDMIQNNILTGDSINLSSEIFSNEVQNILKTHDKLIICRAIRNAIESSFASLYGIRQLELVRNKIKITLNGEKIEDLSEESEFEQYQKSIPDKNDIETPTRWMISYLIKRRNIISKIEIEKYLIRWVGQLAIIDAQYTHLPTMLSKRVCRQLIDDMFSNPEIVEHTTKTAYIMGRNKEPILVDRTQTNEVAHWMKGAFNLKRLGLDGRLFFFNGKYFEQKAEDMIIRETRKCIFQSTTHSVKEVVDHAKAIADLMEFEQILEHSHVHCLQNGTYDAKNGVFSQEFNPEYLILHQLPYSYDETANFDKIGKILDEIFAKTEPNTKQCFLDWLSTAFIPYTGLSFWFIVEAVPGAGKSQLGDLAKILFGIKNTRSQNVHIIAKDATTRIDVAYSIANIDEEMNKDDIRHINPLKKWINQEYFTDRAIHQHNENYRPKSILLSLTNDLFEIPSDMDAQAIYERTMIAVLQNKFRFTEKEVKHIMEKTIDVEQGNGLLTYLLKNATKLYKNDKIESRLTPKNIETIWNKFGNRIREFFNNNYKRVSGSQTIKKDVWEHWQDAAIRNNWPVGGKNTFYSKFEEIANVEAMLERLDNSEREYVYSGIREMTEEEKDTRKQTELKDYE